VVPQRLLGAEAGGFRIDFEGVLSLDDALAGGEYDPKLFVPPEFAAEPARATVEARALVTEEGLYRGVALNGIRAATAAGGGLVLTGTAVNTGTETATLSRIVATLLGPDGRVLWVEEGYVASNIYPGQSAAFRIEAPATAAVEVLSDLAAEAASVNGTTALRWRHSAGGNIPLGGAGGYGAMRLAVTTMTYDPLF
jgi:hypothetical protein